MPIALKKSYIMEKNDLIHRSYALATIHRAENVDDPKVLANFIETENNPPPAGGGLLRTKTTGEPLLAGR